MKKFVCKIIFGVLFLAVLFMFLGTAHQRGLIVRTINILDGTLVPADVHLIAQNHNDTFHSPGACETQTADIALKVRVESKEFETVEFDFASDGTAFSTVTVAMTPKTGIYGVVRHGVSDTPIPNVKIAIEHDGKTHVTTTNENGEYEIVAPMGFYKLKTTSDIYDTYESSYMLSPGEMISELINLIPKDKTKVSFSDYKSYNFEGRRLGHVAGYSQGIHAIIKKNADGTYRIWQDYGAVDSKGTCTIVGNREKTWYIENGVKTEMSHEAVYANEILIKSNEQFMDLLNSLRSQSGVKITTLGVEAINGVGCDKIRVVRDTKATWVGFYDCDITFWVMKRGKLAGMPTFMKGKVSGRDEHHFYFELDVECSITDVGSEFPIQELPK